MAIHAVPVTFKRHSRFITGHKKLTLKALVSTSDVIWSSHAVCCNPSRPATRLTLQNAVSTKQKTFCTSIIKTNRCWASVYGNSSDVYSDNYTKQRQQDAVCIVTSDDTVTSVL